MLAISAIFPTKTELGGVAFTFVKQIYSTEGLVSDDSLFCHTTPDYSTFLAQKHGTLLLNQAKLLPSKVGQRRLTRLAKQGWRREPLDGPSESLLWWHCGHPGLRPGTGHTQPRLQRAMFECLSNSKLGWQIIFRGFMGRYINNPRPSRD